MSMGLITVFQTLGALISYLFVTLAIPCFVFGRKFTRYRYAKRVMLYFIIGNFYAANYVFLLQLIHISNFFTIWFGLLAIPLVTWGILYKFPLKAAVLKTKDSIRKIAAGSLGVKHVLVTFFEKVRRRFSKGAEKAFDNYCRNWPDWLMIAIVTMMVLWVYGTRAVRFFGYAASDIPVHLYWVNGLSDNDIFVAGIYPFGMHAIIYLLGTAFGIDSYVLFRVFAVVQCLAIHIMPVLFLRLCCKSRFAAYPGIFLYTLSNYIGTNDLSRYMSTLPQEYSMIYILPTAYFALSFFKQKRREKLENLNSKDSMVSLAGLIMSFALSFTGHFYGAMIAGIFCVGIGAAHVFWLLRPTYFKRIVAAGILSILIAVLPMVIAYIGGKPLQGSLYWGSNIIKGTTEQSSSSDLTDNSADGTETPPGGDMTLEEGGISPDGNGEWGSGDFFEAVPEPEPPKISLSERLKNLGQTAWSTIRYRINHYVLSTSEDWYVSLILGLIGFLIAAGAFLMLFKKQRSYGVMVESVGLFMVFMSVLFIANAIGLPPLMGADRVCIFYAYSIVIVIGVAVDVVCYTAALILRHKTPMQLLSFAAAGYVLFSIFDTGRVRKPFSSEGLEMNEAVMCLTDIISSEKDYQWTIFSANDETNMVYGHGYHYELSTFLHEIQKLRDTPITVPTESVYFFIEKIPLNYTVVYEGSGQMISRTGADNPVPNEEGLGNYQGRNRWITMSRMYYWAQEFRRLYPNEMTVFFEDDKFVCYKLEQNTYRLFDLAIDYGYNA